ncbi:hypothetical protein CDAR_212061 [Caerostris darwini]|uniref:Uncharacterized protein n=1 Tax=Caerostris darwini TaxID=1538125 RepID=A0AAV4NS26_9ARAC|nr:hypothetical protein CDAR_212061 [Caerostris darwini]
MAHFMGSIRRNQCSWLCYKIHEKVCNLVVGKEKDRHHSDISDVSGEVVLLKEYIYDFTQLGEVVLFKTPLEAITLRHILKSSQVSDALAVQKWSPDERSIMSADGTVPMPPPPRWLSGLPRRYVVSRRTQYYERIWHSSNASATSVVDRGCLDGTANLKNGIRNIQEVIDDKKNINIDMSTETRIVDSIDQRINLIPEHKKEGELTAVFNTHEICCKAKW